MHILILILLVIIKFSVVNEQKLSVPLYISRIYMATLNVKIESFYVDCEPYTNLVFASSCRTLYGQ